MYLQCLYASLLSFACVPFYIFVNIFQFLYGNMKLCIKIQYCETLINDTQSRMKQVYSHTEVTKYCLNFQCLFSFMPKFEMKCLFLMEDSQRRWKIFAIFNNITNDISFVNIFVMSEFP